MLEGVVSIIVRTFDRPALLREAILSAKNQTYSLIEIIVVDDGDISSEVIVNECLSDSPIEWRYVRNSINRGRAGAANLGLAEAQGEFILFLDDDDLILEGHIQKLVDALKDKKECVLAYTDTVCVDASENRLGGFFGKVEKGLIIGSNFMPIHSVLFRRSVCHQGAAFDLELEFFEDWDFWIQLSKMGEFTYVPGETAVYRQLGHCQTRSGVNQKELMTGSLLHVLKKWGPSWSDVELLFVNKVFVDYYHLRNANKALNEELVQTYDERERLKNCLDEARKEVERLRIESTNQEIQAKHLQGELDKILRSRSWRMTWPLRLMARRYRSLKEIIKFALRYHREMGGGRVGFLVLSRKVMGSVMTRGLLATLRKAAHHARTRRGEIQFTPPLGLPPIENAGAFPPPPHRKPVDIIVCIHNALDDTRRCLQSIVENTSHPFRIIMVDDGSRLETASYVKTFYEDHKDYTLLIRNEVARGYTLAANQGLRASTAEYVVLLNSDTVVSQGWVDRLVRCIESNERIGLVGPLSNTASWQSIPEIEKNGDWADNSLPEDITISQMAEMVANYSALVYPVMSFLNGFCMLIRRSVIEEIGYFDEEAFAQGYGEENDYCLRARKAGWLLVLADDVYVYHAQSRSYSDERRKKLSERAALILVKKHGESIIAEGVSQCRHDRVLEGIRSRARFFIEKQRLIDAARTRWTGLRLAFVLPVAKAGGGANVVLTEAKALMRMGVEVAIINLESLRDGFEMAYPNINIPVIYASDVDKVADIASCFDIAIATMNISVYWLAPLSQRPKGERGTTLGYYVQDFEPYFYEDPHAAERALRSYRLIEEMVLFTKTAWNRDEVAGQVSIDCHLIGPSFNDDLFRPRPRRHPSWPSRPLRICAMIRPSSPRRGAGLTMEVLSACSHKFGDAIEIILFGVEGDDPEFQVLRRDFPYHLVGLQRPEQLASLFNEVDIFVDFSTFQAMGLTAMEAMACGVAVIVPAKGGARSYAIHMKNALVIDTENRDECISSLERLITDHELRSALQEQALKDIVQFYPEKSAFLMMSALTAGRGEKSVGAACQREG